MSAGAEARYVPAAGRQLFTRLYDPVVALTVRERAFRGRLLEQVLDGLPAASGRVVDIGSGTGSFAVAVAAAAPAADVIGIDGDPTVLSLARAKPGAVRITWKEGLATSLPLPDAGADARLASIHAPPKQRGDCFRSAPLGSSSAPTQSRRAIRAHVGSDQPRAAAGCGAARARGPAVARVPVE